MGSTTPSELKYNGGTLLKQFVRTNKVDCTQCQVLISNQVRISTYLTHCREVHQSNCPIKEITPSHCACGAVYASGRGLTAHQNRCGCFLSGHRKYEHPGCPCPGCLYEPKHSSPCTEQCIAPADTASVDNALVEMSGNSETNVTRRLDAELSTKAQVSMSEAVHGLLADRESRVAKSLGIHIGVAPANEQSLGQSKESSGQSKARKGKNEDLEVWSKAAEKKAMKMLHSAAKNEKRRLKQCQEAIDYNKKAKMTTDEETLAALRREQEEKEAIRHYGKDGPVVDVTDPTGHAFKMKVPNVIPAVMYEPGRTIRAGYEKKMQRLRKMYEDQIKGLQFKLGTAYTTVLKQQKQLEEQEKRLEEQKKMLCQLKRDSQSDGEGAEPELPNGRSARFNTVGSIVKKAKSIINMIRGLDQPGGNLLQICSKRLTPAVNYNTAKKLVGAFVLLSEFLPEDIAKDNMSLEELLTDARNKFHLPGTASTAEHLVLEILKQKAGNDSKKEYDALAKKHFGIS